MKPNIAFQNQQCTDYSDLIAYSNFHKFIKIITVRHGTTENSKSNVIAGRIDVPLSQDGVDESKKIKDYVAKLNYNIIISSPLSRALYTAMHCTDYNLENILRRDECIERDYGKMQGLAPEKISHLKPKVKYVKVGKYYHSINPPDGESFYQVRFRAVKFLRYIISSHPNKTILVFSHQTFLQQFHGAILGLDTYSCLELNIKLLEFNFFDFDENMDLKTHKLERPLRIEHGSW